MHRSGLVWVWRRVHVVGGPPRRPCHLMHAVLLLTTHVPEGMQPRACS